MAAATPAPDLPTDRNPTSKSIKAFFNSARAPKKTTYDLTPFLSCPAVIARSKKDAYPGYAPEIKVLPIPQTAIPSPLAANLAPERIWSLKEFLCGKVTGDADGNGNANDGYGGNGGNERGKEIWLSWKRAWDLWNNHYIEGRVNPVWVAEEWKRREENEKNAKRDREMRRRTRRRGRTSGQRGGGAPDGDGEGSNLSFVGSDDEDVRCENGSDVVFMRGGSGILGRVAEVPDLDSEEEEVGRHGGRSMRRFDTGQEWGPLPPTAEGKKWIRTECLHTNDSGEDRFDEEWEEVDKLVVERTAPDITNAKTPSTSSASQSQIGSNGGRLEWRTMGSPPPLRGEKWRRTGNKRQQGSWESLEYEEVGESFVEPTGPASAPKPTTSAAPCSQVPVGDNGGKLLYQPTRPPRGLGTKWIFTGYTRMVLDYYKDPEWEMVTGDANATDSTNPSLPLDPPAAWGDQRGRHNGQLRLQNFMPVLTGPAKKWIQTDRKEEGGMRRREWEEIDESVVVIPQTAKEKTAEERMVKILAEQFKIGEELLKTTPKTVTGDTPAPDGDTPKSPRGSRLAWAKLSSPPNSLPGKKWEITYRTKTERGVRLIEFEEVDASSVLPPKPTTKSKFRTAFFTVGSSNDGGRLFPPPSPSPPPSDHSGADPRDLNPKTKHIGHSDDDDYDDYDDYDDDADIVVNHRTISRDGSSGGYYSIKDLADYRLPENDPMSDTYPDWQDVTSNSVWRPRRVGEKKLKIDLDEDIEEFFKNSDMEVWGGVDCGRSPYPVLRSIIEYIHIASKTAFKKKKAWDQVTGTLFNMPMQPVDPDSKSDDEKLKHVEGLYGNVIDDLSRLSPDEVFPLDIRRVRRVDGQDKKPTRLLDDENGESMVTNRQLLQLPDPYTAMDNDDPWWVDPEEKQYRDVPPRRYPPKETPGKGKYLPIDDTLWREEVDNDEYCRARYFITNLKGGALIVNGMEVRRGCVAGPLPEFAVIECPGGQAAFWWGVRGRFWGELREEPNGFDYSSKWDTLRRMRGWDYFGMSAGEVWDWKFRDRKKRESEGEDQSDDEDWQNWKRAKGVKADRDKCKNKKKTRKQKRRDNGEDGGDDSDNNGPPPPPPLPLQSPLPPEVFRSEEEELKWLTAQRLIQEAIKKDVEDPNAAAEPVGDLFWPGTNNAPEPVGAFTPKDVEDEIERSELLKAQEKLSKKAKKDKASKDAAVKAEADAKRQRKEGDGFFFPDLHRIRQEEREAARKRQGAADAKAQAVADAIVQRELVKKAKMDELREAAIKAEMLRDAPPGITKEEIERQRAQAKIDDERSFEARRAIVNAERALKGLPPFPPRKPLDEAATRKAIDDQREAAEERRARDAERAEEQRLAREKQRAKKAEHDRKDREAARVAVKLAADRNKNPERKGC